MMRSWSDSDAEAPTGVLGAEQWDIVRLVATGAAGVLSLFAAFWARGGEGLLFACIWSALLVLALYLSRLFAPVLFEIFAQMHYKERFAMFLAHVGAMLIPVLFGIKGVDHACAALLVFTGLLAIGPVQSGRVYATSGLLVTLGILSPPLPPFAITAVWILALLIAFRAEYLHSRLDEHGTGPGAPARDVARESIVAILIPWVIGLASWGVLAWALRGKTRELVFKGSPRQGVSPIGPVSYSDVYWDAIMMVILIIATLGTIAWIDRKLRSRRRGSQEFGEGELKAFERRSARIPEDDEEVELEESSDARGRVLAAFRRFATSMGRAGWGRDDGETVRVYFTRLAQRLLAGEDTVPQLDPLFSRACYSSLDVSDEEAAEFLRDIESLEPRLHEVLEREKARQRVEEAEEE